MKFCTTPMYETSEQIFILTFIYSSIFLYISYVLCTRAGGRNVLCQYWLYWIELLRKTQDAAGVFNPSVCTAICTLTSNYTSRIWSYNNVNSILWGMARAYVAAQIAEIEPLVTYTTYNFAQWPTCYTQILSLTTFHFQSFFSISDE